MNSALLYVFLGCALTGAAAMVLLRHPMHVAVALVATMLALAGVYGLVGAHAVAIFQVLIYVGAVMVFMVYVIMLLDARDTTYESQYTRFMAPAFVLFILLLTLVVDKAIGWVKPALQPRSYGVQAFAIDFLESYWLYFELVSLLLVAAVVASLAVVRAGKEHHG
jgi:NADH-quinone oxidoreductase subunit J